ncbi:VanZ family protein [uncultured Clostridium sp.]|uniref:VanZ family protein n=1 Tax=uncultured Clostridium sp. TaxID=59620 RepID=UPI0025EA7A53|nr:VanZ family protein [uncultured Clostridium sp.]
MIKERQINIRKDIMNLVLIIIWMSFIFFMSNQPAEASDSQSIGIINILSEAGFNIRGIFGDIANFIIRKCAHFLEYMILAFLIINFIKDKFKLHQLIILAVFLVFLYACTDEFHQLFVEGRDGNFRDVLIDTCGGSLAVLLFTLKNLFIKKK